MQLVGNFVTKSSRLRISDPCYDRDTWCAGVVDNCVVGEWEAFTDKKDIEGWGNRNSVLLVRAEGVEPVGDWELLNIEVGVDADMAGVFEDSLFEKQLSSPFPLIGEKEYERKNWLYHIKRAKESLALAKGTKMESFFQYMVEDYEERIANFDTSPIETTKEFYKACCSISMSDAGAGTIEYGAVSHSGFGDGTYSAYARKSASGEVAEIKIVFITDEETDEYEEYDFDSSKED